MALSLIAGRGHLQPIAIHCNWPLPGMTIHKELGSQTIHKGLRSRTPSKSSSILKLYDGDQNIYFKVVGLYKAFDVDFELGPSIEFWAQGFQFRFQSSLNVYSHTATNLPMPPISPHITNPSPMASHRQPTPATPIPL